MIHNKVTQKDLQDFSDELRELMRKYKFAAVTGIIFSAGTGSSFKMIVDQVVMASDKDRAEAASKMIDQVSVKIGGMLKV